MTAPAITFASAYAQLTAPQRSFVDGYVIEADRAYPSISDALYQPIPADVVAASRGLLEMPLVLAAITEQISALARDRELSKTRVVREIMAVAFANMEDFVRVTDVAEDGLGGVPLGVPSLDMANLTREQWAAVESFEVEMDPRNPFIVRKRKIKLYDKLAAIKMLVEYTGMNTPEGRHNPNSGQGKANQPLLPAGSTVEQAGDRWSAMINQ